MMIDSREISVVMQGPVYGSSDDEKEEITKKCCARIKELLPYCELILSTWEGTDVTGIVYDKVIFNQDPGGIPMILNGVERMNNTNRMIVSTFNGIKSATRKYVAKLRTDIYLENLNFLDKFGIFPVKNQDSLVRERIVSLSANHPKRGADIVFSVSDWFEFGYREDVLKLWDVPLQSSEKMVLKNGKADWRGNRVAESYIWPLFVEHESEYENYLKGYQGVIPVNADSIELYEKSLAEYVVLYEGEQLGINSLKYWNKNYVRRDFARASCYMHYEWEQLYFRYCDKTYKYNKDIKATCSVVVYKIVFGFLQKRLSVLYEKLRGLYNKKRFKNE